MSTVKLKAQLNRNFFQNTCLLLNEDGFYGQTIDVILRALGRIWYGLGYPDSTEVI